MWNGDKGDDDTVVRDAPLYQYYSCLNIAQKWGEGGQAPVKKRTA